MNRKRKVRLLSLLMAMVLVTALLVFNAFAVEEQHYTVSFIIPGQAAPYEVQVVQGQKIGAENMPADPVVAGKYFLGWKIMGSNPVEYVTADTVPTKDITAVVDFTPLVTVLFMDPSTMSGEAQEMQLPLNQPFGDNLPAAPEKVKDGYHFLGWQNTKGNTPVTAETVLTEDMKNAVGVIIIAADVKPHEFDTKWQSNAEGHYHVCTVCGAQSTLEAHKPGPAATTTKPQTCTECGYELAPVVAPTEAPSEDPTEAPSEDPTEAPSEDPTEAPSEDPTEAPSEDPTEAPSEDPTEAPSEDPTEAPSEDPTEAPSEDPTEAPTVDPTEVPSEDPTEAPSEDPTEAPAPVDPTENPSEGNKTPAAPTSAPNNQSTNNGSRVAPATADAQDFVIVLAILAAGSVMVVIGVNKKRGASR